MSMFDPIPHLRRATQAQEARSAELLATLSAQVPPSWQPVPPAETDSEQLLEEEHELWQTENE